MKARCSTGRPSSFVRPICVGRFAIWVLGSFQPDIGKERFQVGPREIGRNGFQPVQGSAFAVFATGHHAHQNGRSTACQRAAEEQPGVAAQSRLDDLFIRLLLFWVFTPPGAAPAGSPGAAPGFRHQTRPSRRIRFVSFRTIREIWIFGQTGSTSIAVHFKRKRESASDEAVVTRVEEFTMRF